MLGQRRSIRPRDRKWIRALGALTLAGTLGSGAARAAQFTVTTTADAGAGSLRAAITSANGAAGADTIQFNIAGAGVRTITVASALPTITGPVFIDGYSQPGTVWNTTDPGSNAVLRIELNGNNAVATGLTVNANDCTIQGFILNRFTTNSINVQSGVSGTRILGNFIGTNALGTAASGTGNGVVIAGSDSEVGGWGAEYRNIFSGATTNAGLRFTGAGASSNHVRVNQFGLSANGTTVIGGLQQGIRFESGANWNQVGETGCCYNRITGATGAGIAIIGAATDNNSLSGNMIWGNGGLGVDLGNDGVTLNDGGDGDTGPNDGQNFPVIQAAMTDEDGRVYVRTAFTGLPSTEYRFDYYANAAPDASGYGEGQLWIGTRYAPTDGSGNLILHATAGSWNNIPAGTMISCTAAQDGTWNTSEFSQNVACYYGRPIVTNTNDVVNGNTTSIMHLVGAPGGDGISLREAIMAANNNLDAWTANYIYFDLPGAGAQIITPSSPLPSLQTSTYLGGWNDPEYGTTPVVRIDGSSAGAGANGLVVDNDWCAFYGLSITNFSGDGIRLNKGYTEIMGCHLGVMPDGTTCAGNGGAGVFINNSQGNSLGNPWWGDEPNVISGNAGGGVVIDGADAAYNAIRHSYIGTNVAGSAAVCVQPTGVVVQNGAHDNTVGTDQLAKRNVIGGHTLDGIRLDNADDNIVLNNYCGTNAAGTAGIPNARAGIMLSDADGNEVGQPGNGNLASGNTDDGIVLRNSNGNVIVSNMAGTRANGLGGLPNGAEGITLTSGSSNNTVGGMALNERNIISGNNGRGLHISGLSNGNTVLGNFIGLNAAGADLGNVLEGIMIENANNNIVGGNTAAARNIISGNGGDGVYTQEGSSSNTISGNHIGTNEAGTTAITNGGRGVLIRDGSNNTVGGLTAADGNLISGNAQYGVMVYRNSTPTDNNRVLNNRIGTNAAGNVAIANTSSGVFLLNNMVGTIVGNNQISGNTTHGIVIDGVTAGASVRGNLIGTNSAGTGALGNGQHGIWVGNSATNITIGGTTVADRNVICANAESGINFQDLANNNTITGNYIGIASNGTTDLGNTFSGIHVRSGATNMTIGGAAAGAGNVISGNNLHGIAFEGSTTASIQGNLIGTNAAGTARIGNNSAGIFLQTNGVTIGGNTPAHRNVISGNNAYGIYIETSFGQGSNNTIIGNYIGTDITGAVDLGNTFNGILMGGSGNRIGGPAAGEGNVISGNDDIGLRLESATNTTVLGNTIGLNAAGTAALGNLVGISLKFASNNNTIGGTTAAARNIISGNGGAGLIIDGSNTNAVQGNYIGTNSAGTLDRGNGSDGIRVLSAASTNTIGGTAAGSGNVISGNGNHGILLNGSATTTVRGNIIGLRAAGEAALGNDHDGIAIIASNNNIIGGSATGAGNTISGNVNPGNSADGIYVDSGSGNTIQGNLIGTDITGTAAFGNYFAGISNIANGTIIGGTNTGEGNIIRNNGSFGVRNQGMGVRILGNAIDANGGIGIDHNSDGVSVNDLNDIDGGANSRQNFPVITSATSSGGNSSITGTLNSNASSNYRIEFFSSPAADPTGYGEGATFLGSVQPVSTDASGNATINANLAGTTIPTGHYVTATATNLATNNTSEFSASLLSGFTISGSVFEDMNYGGGAGRDKATALGSDGSVRANARVELFDAAGTYLASTLTNGSGDYTFSALASGDYQVRVVNSSVSSARTGYTASHRAVQTYMATSDNNVVYPITDHVGGINPAKVDAGNGSTTIAALQTASTEAQSLTWVNIDSQSLTGLDFGFSFNVVCNTNNAGQGSLRQLIAQTNDLSNTGLVIQGRTAGIDHAVFMISNGTAAAGLRVSNNSFTVGIATITPTTGLPAATAPLVLDASTQPGFAGTPIIELNGTTTVNENGLTFWNAPNSVVRGFIINRFDYCGVNISLGSNAMVVAGNYLGTNAAGTAASANGWDGVAVAGTTTNVIIGGTNAADRNVISGNSGDGVQLEGAGVTGCRVIGNHIGTNAAGNAGIGNGFYGVYMYSGSIGNTVGGNSTLNEGNVISGNMAGIVAAGNTTVQGNRIGTNAAGTAAIANTNEGISLEGSNSLIGGLSNGQGNLISGNGQDGILLNNASTNTIVGNLIGTDAAGTADLGNSNDGIDLNGTCSNNTIGGSAAGARNIISGNNDSGIRLRSTAGNNSIVGNQIGTNLTGTTAIGNSWHGVILENSAASNTIGGTTTAHGNVISGNGQDGIRVLDNSNNTTILSNIIGLGADGATDLGNGNDGVELRTDGNIVGAVGSGNIISGNSDDGIEINASSTNPQFHGNRIGTNAAGTAAVANGDNGIELNGDRNVIGGTAAGQGNLISGNGSSGILVDQATATSNTFLGNLIGTNAAGTAAIANGDHGMLLENGASNNTIGGIAAGSGNLISGNSKSGVYIDFNSTGTQLLGNRIGLNNAGTGAIANADDGITVRNGSTGTIIGNGTAAGRNILSGNSDLAINFDSGAGNSTVRGNWIGLNAAGAGTITSGGGIGIFSTSNHVIGGSVAGQGNIIARTAGAGIQLANAPCTNNIIQGNWIGVLADGTTAGGNGLDGVRIIGGPTNNLIGGENAGEGNIIANNGFDGIRADDGTGNRFLRNSISGNGGLGIDLQNNDIPNPNDNLDPDNGANLRQNFPVLSTANSAGGNSRVVGTLNSNVSSPFRIEFFSSPSADASGHGEGSTYLGAITGNTDVSGNFSFDVTIPSITIPAGHVVSAIATNTTTGNSSEFSASIASGFTLSGIVFEDVNYGGGAGRDRSTALANGGSVRPNARVELYNGTGNFLSSTTTNASGVYTFTALTAADYQVRVVNNSVSSSRTGYVASLRAVQTFASTVDNNVVYPVDDMVGGTTPNKVDAGNGSSTLAALQTVTEDVQSLSWVTIDDQDITGVDFGFSFDVVVNTNDVGQGSLRQAIRNANALGNDATLAQAGLVATKENVVFMISNGTAAPGLRAANNYFVAGIATISPQSTTASVTSTLVLDATKQPGFIGTPIVELNGTNAGTENGFAIYGASNSVVRGFIINRFNKHGIGLSLGSSNCVIAGNYIGTNAAGTAASPNDMHGVSIESDAENNIIGGTTAADRNLLSGNGASGVAVAHIGATGNMIMGNYLGTNAAGTGAVPNTFTGVYLFSSTSNTTIGGTVAGSANVISGNGQYGIWIADAQSNTVVGNLIGTAVNGTSALPNLTSGLRIQGGNNTIGGTTAAHRNVISGNTVHGVQLTSATATGNTIIGNYIGVDQTGAAALANGMGVNIQVSATGNTIGGTTVGSANVISGNMGDGIRITNAPGNTVAGNRIGIAGGSSAPIANGQNGIRIQGASSTNNVIGGITSDAANLIYNSALRGVTLEATAGAGNSILRNSISASGNLGIDLNNDGLTANDANDVDGGSNNRQNFPLLFNAQVLGATTRVVGLLQSEASKNYRIEFFNNPTGTEDGSGYGEGLQYMGATDVTTDGTGSVNIDHTLAFATVTNDRVSATATELVLGVPRSTSEFSMNVVANQPPVAICQNATVNLGASGTAAITVAMIDNGSFDPDGTIASLNVNPATVNCSNVGTVNVTLTVTDNSGLTATCVGVVTVVDNISPVITGCPSNITVNAGAACTATATWTVPSITDNCAGGSIVRTTGPAPGSTFGLGATNIVYTATDASGNTSTCAFTVTVVDVTAPTINNCPSNITVNAAPCMNAATWVAPTVSDNCSATIVQTTGAPSGTPLNIGAHTIAYTATDGSGNTAICSFTVTVLDITPPTISCPNDTLIPADPGSCAAANPDLGEFSASSTCSSGLSVSNDAVFPMPLGVHTVTYTASDNNGNTATCMQQVTIIDAQAPVAICQNITVNLGAGSVSIVAAQVNNGSTDNCSIASTSVSPNTFNAVGTYNVTLTVTDAAGNTDDCVAVVTVTDVNPPVAVCQDITVTLDANGNATITSAQLDGGSTDNGTIVSIVAGQTSFDCSDVGNVSVTLTVTDDGGNVSTCDATVTVVDNINPSITCPTNVSVNTNSGCTATGVALGTPITADNCTDVSVTNNAPVAFPIGTTVVTWTVTDNSGNTATCLQNVTVADASAPVIAACSSNISLNAGAACTAVATWSAPTVSDNCGGATITRTAGPASGTAFTIGTTTITYTATDGAGNTATCSFTVTVVDATVPVVVACPSNISLNTGAACTAVATWFAPTVTDNCSGAMISQTAGLASGSAFPLGVSTITYTATDGAGNISTCSFTVTVVDATVPDVVACPSNISLNTGAACTAVATWFAPTVTDNCSGAMISQTAGLASGSAFPLGVSTITYTATDGAGNISTCSFTVTVNDVTAPAIACPANIVVGTGAGICGAVVNYATPVGTDNCSGDATTRTAGLASGSTFPVGTTTVTYLVTDAADLTASCSFTVTVNDTEAPVALCQNITVNLGAGSVNITAAQVNNGSTDNCAVTGLSVSPNSFNAVGTYPVVLTVSDAAGNSSTCNATVTVTDVNPPVAVCQPITVTLDASGNATITSAQLDGGSTDNGTIVSIVASLTSFDCTDVGTVTVTLTVTDDGGNVSTCNATVTVVDNTAPVALCQNVTVNLDASGNATVTAAQVDNGSNDACGIASLSLSQTSFDCSEVGANNVTLTVTDTNGNTATCNATVTVMDNSAPSIVCNSITVSLDNNGQVVVNAADVAIATTDNCGGGQITYSLDVNTFTAVGSYTVTVTATDAAGNSSSCVTTINVTDVNPPVAVCQPITVTLDASGNATITSAQLDGGSTDNGTIVSIVASQTSFDCTDVGTVTVTLTVTDDGGNVTTCNATVTVVDNTAPIALCQNVTVALDASGNTTVTATQVDNSSNDACGIASLSLSQTAFDCSNVGVNNVTLTVTDPSGNVSTCAAVVTVVDNSAPSIVCNSITVSLDNNGQVVVNAADVATATTDNCGGGQITYSLSTSTFTAVGSYTVTVTATDAAGNSSNCVTTINVTDVNPPSAICQPITVTLDASGNATINSTDLDGGSTDNGTIVSIVASQTSFDCTDLGTVTVTLTVTDDGGNVSTCDATVTVVDNTAPVALCQNMTVALDASGNATVTATQVDNGSNDACGIASLSLSQTAFDCSNVGANNVTLTVTDNNGNTATCNATVTVVDNSAPSIVCNSITVSLDASTGDVTVDAADVATATTDNCGGGQITYSLDVNTFTAVGSYTVTVTATDAAGNSSSCVTTINVTDVNPPVAVCQPITVTLDASGNATINSTDLDGGSTDNGTIVSIVASQTSFDPAPNVGTVTDDPDFVTDDGGNVSFFLRCHRDRGGQHVAPVALCQNSDGAPWMPAVTPPSPPAQVDNGSNDACGIASA
jgi:hypothetical protein